MAKLFRVYQCALAGIPATVVMGECQPVGQWERLL